MPSLRLSLLLFALLACSSGCVAGPPRVAATREPSAAYAPWNTAPLARLRANGTGERRGHLLGDVTVYGLGNVPVHFTIRDASLGRLIDALGGLPASRRGVDNHRRITECGRDEGPGYTFSLRDVRRRDALVLVAKVAGKRIVVAANVEGRVDLEVQDAAPDLLLMLLAGGGGLVIVAQAEDGPLL